MKRHQLHLQLIMHSDLLVEGKSYLDEKEFAIQEFDRNQNPKAQSRQLPLNTNVYFDFQYFFSKY